MRGQSMSALLACSAQHDLSDIQKKLALDVTGEIVIQLDIHCKADNRPEPRMSVEVTMLICYSFLPLRAVLKGLTNQ